MEVEIPDAMVDAEAEKLVNQFCPARDLFRASPFDQYLAMMGMTMEQMKEQAKEKRPQAGAERSGPGRHRGRREDRSHRRGGRGRGVKTSGGAVQHDRGAAKKVLDRGGSQSAMCAVRRPPAWSLTAQTGQGSHQEEGCQEGGRGGRGRGEAQAHPQGHQEGRGEV